MSLKCIPACRHDIILYNFEVRPCLYYRREFPNSIAIAVVQKYFTFFLAKRTDLYILTLRSCKGQKPRPFQVSMFRITGAFQNRQAGCSNEFEGSLPDCTLNTKERNIYINCPIQKSKYFVA